MAGPAPLSLNIEATSNSNNPLDSVVPNMPNIIQALDIIHSPTSTNAIRQQASEFLESQKHAKSAADTGYSLAMEKNNSPVLRHFGLSLLEHFLRHSYSRLPKEKQENARGQIFLLAKSVSPQDESFIGNKVALLWVEGAKRSWGAGKWTEMDADLIRIWNMSWAHKKLVLSILETLSDDIFNHEDKTSSHESPLHRALVEIVPPYSVFEELHLGREHHGQLRYRSDGSPGWLFMTCDFLSECLNNIHSSREAKICAAQALATLRSLMIWSNPLAISTSMCVEITFKALTCQNDDILMAAIDALHALYSRSYDMTKFQDLVNLVYQTQNLHLLQNLYNWSIVDAHDISDSKYSISKKLSELMSYIAGFLEEKNFDFHKDIDLATFFPFLVNILQHPSLTVSIPILHSWSRLLASSKITSLDVIHGLIAPILETCTQRLVRYETLPEDTNDPTIIFLNEDIDTIPERHAFVGNYRRYCAQTIELIVYQRPHDAIPHILARADYVLNNLYNAVGPFNPVTFKKYSLPSLQADTQFTVVEATLRGFNKWVEAHGKSPQQDEQQRLGLESSLESWALNLMQKNFEDPIVKERVIRLSVDFCYKALKNNPSFALKVLEHILMTNLPDRPEFPAYSEAVKELHNMATYEVRRLTIRYADYFSTFYDVLEQKIQEIVSTSNAEDRPQMELSSILLIIMQRAPQVDPVLRQSRLQLFIEPIRQSWSSEEFKRISTSFEGFCQILGLEQIWPYLQRVQAQKVEDWSTIPLDEEGKKIQAHMTSKFQQLPLRMTKTMLSVSTEKLQVTDPAYSIACELWRDSMPLILPTLLQLLSHAHAFHNPENCPGLPQDMRPLVGRILTDRFWQAGISSGSREDFYARITTSKATLEGFSSSVRGKVRAVREACYSILYSMSRLREHFYSFEELPVPLSQALFKDATSLSCHQLSVLLNISRCLVDDCPARFRPHFLPPILSALFIQIDKKITTEWDIIEHRKAGMVDSDLTVEMKDESILRQLTYSVVMMVASLLDPQRGDPEKTTEPSKQNGAANQPTPADSIRHFILSSPQILEPVILFCTHAIRMKDTRCCAIVTRVIRSILDVFVLEVDNPTAKSIREFISTDILKACITSVHEPYFVDMQKELAQLIASIWVVYGTTSDTPTKIIESLPDMSKSKVAATYAALRESGSGRQQRALVLDLLEGLRGVSISEQGRIAGPPPVRRKPKSALQERYTTEMEGQEGGKVDINSGPDLTGVADMFSL
ncbi:exportin-5 [[Emmonsia] crescens]|uniref:Exportin-5 n=1 Tax=[Emmonsia] crescens TaxID=73230 RepID=A0A2B7Z7Z1_9EURO|nr:exportin-5 [Emmonsia crescens]